MKILIANSSRQTQGGGWSWIENFRKGMGDSVTENYEDANIFFIPSASMIKPELAEQAKLDGKKIILRTDNALKHSRNDGKGMARMKRMADLADLVVYQCQWAKDYLDDYLGKPNSTTIYNGIDLDTFKPEGTKTDFGKKPVYLFASAAKNETKRWEWAWWCYQKIQKENPNALLLIAGNISTPVKEHGFDFFQGESHLYLGMVHSAYGMADVYRSSDYFFACAENDCYSNAILESLACGVEPIEISQTGGTPELLDNWYNKGRDFNGVDRMCLEYQEAVRVL